TGEAQLEFWTPIDSRQIFQELTDSFANASKGHVIISNFVKKDFNTYEQELVSALAAGKGPDVFLIPNSWIPKHADKIRPMPAGQGFMNLREFQDTFVDVAAADLIRGDKIYGLPLFVDTLALFYNKNLLANAGIPAPPKNWVEFQEASKKMTKIDALGRIIQSGSAMGGWSDRTGGNINQATDILTLLMMQVGAQMIDANGMAAAFDKPRQTAGGESILPGVEALRFYTNFANTANKAYSWNSQIHHSIDSFSEGALGMMLNYAYNIPIIQAKNPHLDFGIAPAPQAQKNIINLANYFVVAVSIQSKAPNEAWQFAQFITGPNEVWKYLNTAKRPAAIRQFIDQQKKEPVLGVFAEQALTARTWYRVDAPAIERIFDSMIESVVRGRLTIEAAIRQGASEVTLLMQKR
ncbi:MAG: extracellular solute-binding protein, partial [bacterium]|nr:extracellular solute-binding protein [bacterium]